MSCPYLESAWKMDQNEYKQVYVWSSGSWDNLWIFHKQSRWFNQCGDFCFSETQSYVQCSIFQDPVWLLFVLGNTHILGLFFKIWYLPPPKKKTNKHPHPLLWIGNMAVPFWAFQVTQLCRWCTIRRKKLFVCPSSLAPILWPVPKVFFICCEWPWSFSFFTFTFICFYILFL